MEEFSMFAVTKEEQELFAEVRADQAAYRLLKHKASWERMSLYAVLKCWGDPRKWRAYETQNH